MECLQHGFLAPLRERVLLDKDLDLEIRDKYLNIYFKGNSLLRLAEAGISAYRPSVDPKFLGGVPLTDFIDSGGCWQIPRQDSRDQGMHHYQLSDFP